MRVNYLALYNTGLRLFPTQPTTFKRRLKTYSFHIVYPYFSNTVRRVIAGASDLV